MSLSRDYPIINPTLLLDFANTRTLDPKITFTRADATTCATQFNALGVLETVAANIPRFDHNPSTLAAQGLLIEEARTNSLPRSEEFSDASWTKSGATVTANSTTAPSNTATADTLVEDTSTGQHRVFRSVSGTTNTNPYTYSFFAKASTRTRVYIGIAEGTTFVRQGNAVFDLSAGTVVIATTGSGGATGGSATIQNVGNGWYRCTYTLTLGGTDTTIFGDINLVSTGTTISYTGNGTSGLFIWGAQLEAGAFPTSYIPTTTAAVTRAADVAAVNTLSPWYNASEGTFVLRGNYSYIAAGTPGLARLDDNSENERYMFAISSGTQRFTVVDGGSEVVDISRPGVVAGTPFTQAGAYKVGDFAACINGGTVGTYGAGALPTVTRLIFRRDSTSGYANGHIQRITYYPRRLSNAELVSITTP